MKKDEKNMKKVLRSPCNLSLCAYRQRDNNQLTNMKTIRHYFFENNGVLIIFNDGTRFFELTPKNIHSTQHLENIKKSLK